MRLHSVSDAITNSSSEIFTFGTKSLDEIYDAMETLWEEYRVTPEARACAKVDGYGYRLEYSMGDLLLMAKNDSGCVYVQEEEEYILDHLGFNRVIREHFGDLITGSGRS